MNDKYYQLVKQKYQTKGRDFTELFQTILDIGNEIGLDKSLEYLERCVIEKRLSWLNDNLENIEKTGNPIDDAYRIFYEIYLGISTPEDGEVVEKTDKKLLTRWWNYCPVLKVCEKLGLDTRVVCKKAYHNSTQIFLSNFDTKVRFDRNYHCIRPYSPYCEEIITLEE
ncbi:MAG: hypothetical protein ACE5K3_09375 [bacterium]